MVRDTIVIGGGIIGATVAATLAKNGATVLLFDDSRPNAGTPPSGGHFKPSWLGEMKKQDYEPAMQLLDDVWGVLSEEFVVRPVGTSTTVYRVDIDKVMEYPRVEATVREVSYLDNYPMVALADGTQERCRLLVVAAGVWCQQLLNGSLCPSITAKQGVSFRAPGNLSRPFIKPWAPFKQVVAHQQRKGEIWIGDGTAVMPRNWAEDRTIKCFKRCQLSLGRVFTPLKTMVGHRPYCKLDNTDPCLLKRLGPRAWLATGSGKLGTIAAGWVAGRILNESS